MTQAPTNALHATPATGISRMNIDPRFIHGSGREIYTGNELLVKGALETPGGVHLLTGYPGSPVAGFFDTCESIAPLLRERGIVARIANNEAISVAMVNGSQMVEARSIVAMKNVGVHVAADALALGVLAGTKGNGGVIVVCGDDPWSDSTQVPVDSRYIAEHLRMPMLEPSNPQEVKDWIALGFQLSKAGQIYIGYMMTVALADGGGSVEVKPNQYPTLNTQQQAMLSYEKDIKPHLDQFVLLPPRSWLRELGMDARHAAVNAEARKLGINRIIGKPQKDEKVPLGFIAPGMGYAYLVQALEELGLTGKFPILKIGLSYPLDAEIVTEFARHADQVVVIEERRGFVEKQVHEILAQLRQRGETVADVWGKKFPRNLPGIPSTRGLHPSLLIERLVALIRQSPSSFPIELTNGRLTDELQLITETARAQVNIPVRTATFCPGCPHRDSSDVLLELRRDLLDPQYMQRTHKSPPIDLVAHGDTGCYTMLMFEPNVPLMHNYSGMGLGGATGAGVDPFIDNKQLVFMGDGTFFHSGQLAITNSIANGQDITYIILDNRTTAMTGHQSNFGNVETFMGEKQTALNIERIVKGMVPKDAVNDVRIVRMNPEERDSYRRMMEQTILAPGVKIVIADKECGITFHRRRRSEERKLMKDMGFLPKQTVMNVAEEVCEYCLECTNQTGCPGLKIVDTDYGSKIQTDSSWCVNDGACARIDACPSFEELTITRRQPARLGDLYVDLNNIPDAPRPIHADQDTWRAYLAGVGGMGIGLVTSIIVTAGNQMGYHVQFLDKKGLAIRNGGVFSQIVFTRNAKAAATTPAIPFGKADVLLGVDLLEACRSVDPKQPYRVASKKTVAVVNTAKTPTILTLMGRDDFDPDDLEVQLRKHVHPDQYFGFNVGDLCERVLDTKLYANIMMLGMAYQLGYLPMTYEALSTGIQTIIRQDIDRNMRAFNIGRMIVVRPDLFTVELRKDFETARQAFRRKSNLLRLMYKGKRGEVLSKQYRVLMKQLLRAKQHRPVSDDISRDVIIRAYDCLVWGGIEYAKSYCKRVLSVYERDNPDRNFEMTRAVVWNLAKVMLIKDEPYVAAMLTSPEKYKRDQRRWKVNPARGDKITYKHHNRPEFDILGKTVRFHWKSRDWQLRLMARCKFLRDILPGWHRREREYRDWFSKIVDRIDWRTDAEYTKWVAIMNTPQTVTGFREVRYPKMEAARSKAENLLSESYDANIPTEPRVHISLTNRILHEERV